MPTTLRHSDRLPQIREERTYRNATNRLRSRETRDKPQLSSVQDLVRSELMNIIWQGEHNGKHYQMGFMRHSQALKIATRTGRLKDFFKALSNCYRDVYGDKPWQEYLCCSNPDCTGSYSIEDVYGRRTEEKTLEDFEDWFPLRPEKIACPIDGAEMQFFYPPQNHLKTLQESFQQQVFATLLFEGDHKVMGFCLGWETSIGDCWQDKIIAGEGDPETPPLSYEEYLEEVKTFLGQDRQAKDRAINLAEWGVRNAAKRSGTAVPLMRELYAQALEAMRESGPGEDFPVLAHTLKDSRAFGITQAFGFHAGRAVPPHGEVRSYLPLSEAIEGIDHFMQRKKGLPIKPISPESQEAVIPRDTLVMEMLLDKAVGTDKAGEESVHRYLAEVARTLKLKPLQTSVTHLSPLYGLSGWLPLENGAAIHLYAWDYNDGSHPPFLSIDISTPGEIIGSETLLHHAKTFFQAREPLTEKHLQDHGQHDWQELAPQIHRQRLNITGKSSEPITEEKVKSYLQDLAPALDMVQLSEPLIIGHSAWIHWETSGVVLHWDDDTLSVDIYTCKAFDDQDALVFTEKHFGLSAPLHKSY